MYTLRSRKFGNHRVTNVVSETILNRFPAIDDSPSYEDDISQAEFEEYFRHILSKAVKNAMSEALENSMRSALGM